MVVQYTKWQTQLTNKEKMTGGSGSEYDVNVSAVPLPLIKIFTVSDTANPAVTVVLDSGSEKWYLGGKPYDPTFPLQFGQRDGTVLTIDRNSETPGDLNYTQA